MYGVVYQFLLGRPLLPCALEDLVYNTEGKSVPVTYTLLAQ
jgi:hypothetical protein